MSPTRKLKLWKKLVRSMVKKMTAQNQGCLQQPFKRCKLLLSEATRDYTTLIDTKVVKGTEEAHKLIKDIDNAMKKFNKQNQNGIRRGQPKSS